MIQANELRVGNFVRHKDYPNDLNEIRGVCRDRVHPIELIEHDNNSIYAHQCTLSDLEPIPLTEENIVKLREVVRPDFSPIVFEKREPGERQ